MFADALDVEAPKSGGSADSRIAGTIALTDVVEEGEAHASGDLRYDIALYSNEGGEIDHWTLATPRSDEPLVRNGRVPLHVLDKAG